MTLENIRSIAMTGGTSSPILYDRVFEILKENHAERQSKVLDIGCGQGELLHRLNLEGYSDLSGCDAFQSPSRIPTNAAFTQTDLRSDRLPYLDQSFDVVMSIEVIEHLENPRAHVRELTRLCKSNGLILLSTPNVENWFSKLSFCLRGTFQYFGDRDYPAHITPVLPIDLKRIFNEAGLTHSWFRYSNQGRIPGLKTHWQQLLGSRLGAFLFSEVSRSRGLHDGYIVARLKKWVNLARIRWDLSWFDLIKDRASVADFVSALQNTAQSS